MYPELKHEGRSGSDCAAVFWIPEGADVIPKECPACPLLSAPLTNLQETYRAGPTHSSLHEAEVGACVSSPVG